MQFQQVGLMNENYNYILTNLDAHTENLEPYQYSGANITGVSSISTFSEPSSNFRVLTKIQSTIVPYI